VVTKRVRGGVGAMGGFRARGYSYKGEVTKKEKAVRPTKTSHRSETSL